MACFAWPLAAQSPYTLTVESSPAVTQDLTTYRFYVNVDHPDDVCFTVFGNQDLPMLMSSTEPVFNTPYNSSWSASGLVSAFVGLFPEMVDDTYATIGLMGPAVEAEPGSVDPGLADSDELGAFFQNTSGNAMGFYTPSYTGSAWHAPTNATNAQGGEELRILVMQVTTSGEVSGYLNYRVVNEGLGAQIFIHTPFEGSGTFEPELNGEEGCMDTAACNFNPNAVITLTTECAYPGSFCYYGVPGEVYYGTYNDACYCIAENESGCTYPTAVNYNPYSTVDDGSCIFPEQPCGPGTFWDDELGLCVVAMPSDSNFDGCVQLEDLLAMLVHFGSCSEP